MAKNFNTEARELQLSQAQTLERQHERESYLLRQATMEPDSGNFVVSRRKLEMLRRAGMTEEIFHLENPEHLRESRRLIDMLLSERAHYHVMDVDGMRLVFMSPEVGKALEGFRAKMAKRLTPLND